ncbi:putative cardiolipin synthase YwiE [Zhongshania aliphaticivorans]|uniref:Cardiolipin synthase n=1 Tax=Zhongshania aliphaticivorans TaxID=1470434 RepID=A0A5S9PZH4_9GAMM|nr:cardiolipin synthase [Zhongshania aliphaticivorans]CAA0092708.1 putative cardiolipin synthase YwiE [Zhongshania aliphaticivorans]CAA0110124.1 putative cardiolipin synthase YwiE [Zhongshania aliphaticivorans]
MANYAPLELWNWITNNLASISALLAAVFAILGMLSALEAILKTRTAQGAVAWAIVLIGFPPLFVPLYWIFGRRKFRGYALAKRNNHLQIDKIANTLLTKLPCETTVQSSNDPRLIALEQLTTLPFSTGNTCQLLINGHSAFKEMFAQIDAAKHYVLLEFYIIRDDEIGHKLAELLIKKAQQGVCIYCVYDEIGSLKLSNQYLHNLRKNGVNIRPFNSTKGLGNRLQLNFRNHRKIVVCDGNFALVGGMNIGDEYRDMHPVLTPWRDTGIAISGPAAQAVQLAFAEDWFWANESLPALNWQTADTTSATNTLVLATGPADSTDSCALYFLNMIHQATKRLWIVSPYFVPDAPVIHALQLAAMRGIDVRIMLPAKPDKLLIQLSSYTAIKETLTRGVQFYYYQEGFLHQKVMLVDDDISVVGTANMDNRSFRLNFELCIINHSVEFASKMEDMLNNDFKKCRQLLPREVAQWSLKRRLLSRCAYLFAPLQ